MLVVAVAAVGAIVAVAAVILLGDDDQPQSQSPPSTSTAVQESTTPSTGASTTTSSTTTTSTTTLPPTSSTTTPSTTTAPSTKTLPPTSSAAPAPASITCQNATANYQLDYPADWFTPDDPEWACALFDQYPITLVPDTELPPAGVVILDLPGSFEDNATIVADPVDAVVLQSIELEIAGRPTLCSSLEAIGEGYYPAGTQSFSCVIDWGPSSLLIDVVDWGTTDFDASLDVLDMIFASIAPLTPLPPPAGG